MKRKLFGVLAIVGLLSAFMVQALDVNGTVDTSSSVIAGIGINAARTGSSVDRASYAGAMLVVAQGHVTNGAGAIVYWVIQDSVSGGTWANRDSVVGDTVDNKTFEKNYTGSRRFLRVIQRATSASSDTTLSAGLLAFIGKRSR